MEKWIRNARTGELVLINGSERDYDVAREKAEEWQRQGHSIEGDVDDLRSYVGLRDWPNDPWKR